jgi:hypothetical protein
MNKIVCGSVLHVRRELLKPGLRLAYREGRKAGAPIHQVRVIDGKLRGRKVEVIFIVGGLRMWVAQSQLLCAWSERNQMLREEARRERLVDDWQQKYQRAIDDAMQTVLVSTGDSGGALRGWTEPVEVLERLWRRAGMNGSPWEHPLVYKSGGVATLPWDTVVEFCLAFCAQEPQAALSVVEGRRLEYHARAQTPGERVFLRLLTDHGPGDALVREWCGAEAERAAARAEVKRLRELLHGAGAALKRAGDHKAADRLERGLRGL